MSLHSSVPNSHPFRLTHRRQLGILGAAGGAALLLILAIVASGRMTAHAEAPASPAPPGAFRPTQSQWRDFQVRTVQAASFQDEQDTDGRIATNDDRTTPVFSPYTGRVTRVLVQAGAVVKKGQPLFAVQGSEFVQAQNDLGTAAASAQAAQVQVTTAAADEARLHQLYQADGASLKEWQASLASLAAAQAALRSADVSMSAVQSRLKTYGETDAEIGALAARARAGRIQAEAVVLAPVGGTVVTRTVEPGQFVSGATSGTSTQAFSISDLSTVWLVANVREADAGKVRLGDQMNVRVLAYPDRIFHAKVTYIAPAVDPATRRLAVRAEIANPAGLLIPEMFADFGIDTGPASNSLAVPEDAVIYEGTSAHVWLAKADHSLVLQPVRLGRTSGGQVEVLDGLKAGDRVATSGALFIDRAVRAG